jgi:hypothetical protein
MQKILLVQRCNAFDEFKFLAFHKDGDFLSAVSLSPQVESSIWWWRAHHG